MNLYGAWKAYYIRLRRLNRVSITAGIYNNCRYFDSALDRINTYTAVQQANKPIDVNNNNGKSKLFIKNENQKSF